MSVFEQYHRADDRRRFWVRLPVVLLVLLVVCGIGWSAATAVTASPAPEGPTPFAVLDTGAPGAPSATASAPAPGPVPGQPEGDPAAAAASELPAITEDGPAPSDTPVIDPRPADDALASWFVDVATSGHQAEVDRCVWVRMDVGATAPIVGAHNNCGGGIVLDMALGDTVTVVGEGLDGRYTVTGEGAGYGGQNAAAATEGMAADVILQTCFLGGGGHARLVALTRLGAAD